MIEKIDLKGFRGIAKGAIETSAQINLFVGPNNAGKSTILEAIYLASVADVKCELGSTEGEFFLVFIPAETDMLGLEPLARMWERHGFPARWEKSDHTARWDEGNIRLNLPAGLQDYNLLVSGDSLTRTFPREQEQRMAMFAAQLGAQEEILPAVKAHFQVPWERKRFAFIWFGPFTYRLRGLGAWSVTGELPSSAMTLFYDSQVAMEHLPASLVERGHRTTDWLQRIGRHFGAMFDLDGKVDVTFDPAESDSTRRVGLASVNGQMHPIDIWGDGARHAFKLLAPLIILADEATPENPGLLLWEDPELFMNPQTLGRLLRTVVTMVEGKPIQVFMSTQSIEVIACLARMLQRGEVEGDRLTTFRLGLRKGRLVVSRFSSHNLIAWLENGADPRVWEQIESPLEYRLGGEE